MGSIAPAIVVGSYLSLFPLAAEITALAIAAGAGLAVRYYLRAPGIGTDYSVAIVLLCTQISSAASNYRPNSIIASTPVLVAGLVYIIIRSIRSDSGGLQVAIALWSTVFSALCLYHFCRAYAIWRSLNFRNAADFRLQLALFPSDRVPGSPNFVFILLAGILALGLQGHIKHRDWYLALLSGLALVANLVCMALTFSRVVYLSAGVLVIGCVFALFSNLRGTRSGRKYLTMMVFGSVLVGVVVLGICGLLKPVLSTCAMLVTESQWRSLEGRLDVLGRAIFLSRKHLLWGVGVGNFAMNFNSSARGEAQYVTQPFNWYVRLLVEQGVIGLMAWLQLFTVCLANVWTLRQKPVDRVWCGVSITALASAAVYGLQESTLVSAQMPACVLMSLFAFLANHVEENRIECSYP